MKIWIAGIASLMFVALDWAALHDILKGEPDIAGELATIALSVVPFALLGTMLLRRYRGRSASSA